MKCAGLLMFFLSINSIVFTQLAPKDNYSNYRLKIDSLRNAGLLNKSSLENMHGCGGAVEGYFYNNQLVLIDSWYGGEVGGSGQKAYLYDSTVVEFEYFENFPDWSLGEMYLYDSISGDFIGEINVAKIVFQMENDGFKLVYSEGKIQGISDADHLLIQLMSCIELMRQSLLSQRH